MAYIYRHIRLDKNEPFYIGIGKDNNQKFTRAYSKKGRSSFWRSIVSNYGYEVEIILDDLTWEEACKKEKEFIALYGRKDLGLGTLVNFTNGGDGVNGYTHNQNRLDKLSKNSKGSNNPRAKSCTHFDSSMKFDCLKDGCDYFNLKYSSQISAIRKRQSTAQFYFENEYFKRPTKEEISKKLGILRIGNQNWKGKTKSEKK
jgi:hypothetical protein